MAMNNTTTTEKKGYFPPNFQIILEAQQNASNSLNSSSSSVSNGIDGHITPSDNTFTFIIGFSILICFIVLGMVASAFLCIILKKDPYLWEMERDRQLQSTTQHPTATNSKERDKIDSFTENTEI